MLAKRLGLKDVYVLDDGTSYWKELLADPFRRTARKLGVGIAGSSTFKPAARSYDAVVEGVARSGVQGVLIGGDQFAGGDRLLKALRSRLGERTTIMAGFLFGEIPLLLESAGPAARGLYVTTTNVPRSAMPLTAAGRRFSRDVGASGTPLYGVLEAGQAAQLVLDAIARSDGTRASVLEELRASKVEDGILGSFRFDDYGDITAASIPILRVTGATPPGSGLPESLQGAVVDRVIKVPTSLPE